MKRLDPSHEIKSENCKDEKFITITAQKSPSCDLMSLSPKISKSIGYDD